ncbi:hypothetical protein [Pseudoalteromonas sp. Of7M-16]|nr:hypothetical protein [Pseudoalteromonas sp. Of7M-16]
MRLIKPIYLVIVTVLLTIELASSEECLEKASYFAIGKNPPIFTT